ncbi:PREDICTED: rootletin-like [Priapulus caudatus]|uniref:Rootletin-like n=1 Tax=Priapulus caudatus TaxID=37621 RepID=A0ABM1E9H4_PRICU|nr:PREDICTED: rootletin-like [Priapulus caudatus]
MTQQEDTIRRGERERKSLMEKLDVGERQQASGDNEKKQLGERINKLKTQIERMEQDKKQLRENLEVAETHCTKLELAKRGLEGDLQRQKLKMNDIETDKQCASNSASCLAVVTRGVLVTVSRSGLSRHVLAKETSDAWPEVQQLQRELSASEHDRRVLQEKLDGCRMTAKRVNMAEAIRPTVGCVLQNRVENLLKQVQDAEDKGASLQLTVDRQTLTLAKTEQGESELKDKHDTCECVPYLVDYLGVATLPAVEREKILTEEQASKTLLEKTSAERTLSSIESENLEMQRQVQNLQAALAEQEQQHAQKMIDLTTRHRTETEMETERLRTAQQQAERTLDSRERSHRMRIKSLEEQVAHLKDQQAQEMRKRNLYISRSSRAGDDMKDLRALLGDSLSAVSRDRTLDPILLEHEIKKLDDSMAYHGGGGGYHDVSSPPSKLAHRPLAGIGGLQRTRSISPARLSRPMSSSPSFKKRMGSKSRLSFKN